MQLSNLEKIRAKCVETNPSILDLKFGCEVKCIDPQLIHNYGMNPNGIGYHRCVLFDVGEDGKEEHRRYDCDFIRFNPKMFQILGREIQLADVLMLPDTEEMKTQGDEKNAIALFKFIKETWNLREPLSGQSPECLEFLANLLSV